MGTRVEPAKSARDPEREWWLRIRAVLHRPEAVFTALRDDSPDAAASRQEPLTAVVFLAGISIFLSTGTAGHLFDNHQFDVLLVAVEAVLAGVLVGLQNLWVVGGALALGIRAAEGTTSYRQARHVVGFALAPFIVSLILVWPIRIAIYGGDLFRSGGSDSGNGGLAFNAIDALFLAWSVALVVYGTRALHGWSWRRSLAACSLAGVFVGLLVAAVAVL